MTTVAIVVAIVALTLLAVRDPLEASHRAKAARQLAAGESHQRAAVEARAAVSLDPGRGEYWNELGLAQLRTGDLAEGAESFREAWRRTPYQVTYALNLVRAQLSLAGKGDRRARSGALDTSRVAKALDPYVNDVYYMLTLAEAANGNHDETIAAAERLLEFGGTADALITETAAGAYIAAERPGDAERWIRRIVPGDGPNNPRLRVVLARALAAQGRIAEALHQADLALQADPTNEAAQRLRTELSRRSQ